MTPRAHRRMRRLGRFAARAAGIGALACVVAMLASPAARRGYGLWLAARGMRMPGDARGPMTVSASVDHMPRVCRGGSCGGDDPLHLIVTPPAGRWGLVEGVQADSAWIIAGPAVYGVRMKAVEGPFRPPRAQWIGTSQTGLPLHLVRVGVIVRFREPGRPAHVLRFYAVPVDYTW